MHAIRLTHLFQWQIVGLKPTWGLVPYTGIISLECTIDHAGPMTKTVRDAALLLEAIAGPDGIDDRQPPYLPPGTLQYTSNLDVFLLSTPEKPLTGIKIGILDEGFTIAGMEKSISTLCASAVAKFRDLGATVSNVSIPSHTNAAAVAWMLSIPIAGGRQGFLSDMTGRKQLYLTDRVAKSGSQLSQQAFDALGPGAQNLWMRKLYLEEKYGPELHAKCSNLLRKISVSTSFAHKHVNGLTLWHLLIIRDKLGRLQPGSA